MQFVISGSKQPHHHILLFLKDSLIKYVDKIDQIIPAELPAGERKGDLRDLVKSAASACTLQIAESRR